ncbi:V-MYB [Symbiodinium sp. KB8]|nr:V-MYB [Symbiodinium sp. KB8]
MPRRREKKKAPWSQEEDSELRRWVAARYGEGFVDSSIIEWSQAASEVFHNRSTKQIRERWCNVLDPSIKRDEWAEHELRILFEAQQELGNKWSEIAKRLPGRPEAAVKNTFYSSQRRARRRLQRFGENRTPNLTEIAIEAIEACKTAQALKQRREQARMRVGSGDEEDDLDGALSLGDDTPTRKGKGKAKRGARKSTGGRKRSRDAGLTDVSAGLVSGLGGLGDLGTGGLDPLSLDPSNPMRMGALSMNMSMFTGSSGLTGLSGPGMVPGLGVGGMGVVLPGLGTSGFGAGLGVSGGLASMPGMNLPTSADFPAGQDMAPGDASSGPRPAVVNLPPSASNLLAPLAEAAFANSATPALLHPDETVIMLCRYHKATNSTIPLQWNASVGTSMDTTVTSAALASAGGSAGQLAAMTAPMGLPPLTANPGGDLPAPDTNLPPLPAGTGAAPGDAPTPAPAPVPAQEQDAPEAEGGATGGGDAPEGQAQGSGEAPAPAPAAAAGGKKGVDDKAHVAEVLASLGNGWIKEGSKAAAAGSTTTTEATTAAAAANSTAESAGSSATGVAQAAEQATAAPAGGAAGEAASVETAAKRQRTDSA